MPWRRESEDVDEVNRKCKPGGRDFMPWKRGEVVNESRSMPHRQEDGRERSNMVGAGVEAMLERRGLRGGGGGLAG